MERERRTEVERARRDLGIRTDDRAVEREVPVPAGQLSADEALEIAIDAYVYAYPMVLMDVTRVVSTTAVPADGRPLPTPMNQFSHARVFPDPTFTGVVRPNADTLYSSLWFDVSQEPLVVDVPDSRGRYYLLPMLDMWTDVFASPGKRTSGTGAQRFAIVGPRWSGTLPDDVEPVRAPTSFGWVIGRTQTNGAADYEAVHRFQAGLRASPLSAVGREDTAPPATVDPSVSTVPPVEQVAKMDGVTFFSRFAAVAGENPPHPNDNPLLQRVRRLGIAPGAPFALGELSHNAAAALDRAVPFAQRKMRDHATRAGRIVNGWSMISSPIGTYGTDYVKRAMIAVMGLGANTVEDAIYPTAFAMADGSPFDSDAKYELRFPHSALPPVRAFWSLTMYDDRQLFADNPIGRYAIGDRDPLHFDSDGSLMLYIQRESPGRDKESNWLPTPQRGAFTMNLRLYWPEPAALDGTWAPPLVRRVSDHHRPTRRS
jgi:hypothetical protein